MVRSRVVAAAAAFVLSLSGFGSGFVGAGLLGTGLPGTGSEVAGAVGAHRALVIVDTGVTTYQRVITFAGDSVTGIQALELAGAEPVVYSFAGQGGAVCRLFGVGRDAGPNCLGGADGDSRYWAYFRAPSGTSSFTYSRAGAGSVQVRDGDVEGWKFGTGQAPTWSALPPPATTTTTAPPAPPTPTTPGSGGGTSPGPTPTGATGAPLPAPPPGATPEQITAFWAALASTTTTIGAPVASEVQGKRASRRPLRRVAAGRLAAGATAPVIPTSSDDGSGAGSLVLFAIVAVALGGGGLLLRRSRRRVS